MPDEFLLGRLLLEFQSDAEDLLGELSAIARSPDGSLWLGSDEYLTLERLTPMGNGIYGNHTTFHLKDFVDLFDLESEIDIEGLDYADGYLWVVGSHSLKRNKPKGKNPEKDIQRLAEIKTDPNRYLLARLPILNGELVRTYGRPETDSPLTAALLEKAGDRNVLMEALAQDEHIGPFITMGLPSKENGFDIEGLAVRGGRVFLGLRGPVLRGWAIILEIEPIDASPGTLALKDLGDGIFYRKHFLNLDGQGIRELCFCGGDLLVLAGPTMDVEGSARVFRLKGLLESGSDTLSDRDAGSLDALFEIPTPPGADKAEGLAIVSCLGYDDCLAVVYDSPHASRRPQPQAVFADVFRLPT